MRFIQVGVGGFGKGWVNWLKANRSAKVVGMVDISADALKAACEAGGYDPSICFPSLQDALKSVEADAVVCVTPPEYHRQPVVEAMKAGLDVISEKPMAETLSDCTAMLRAARETGRTFVVSQNYRYRPCTWTIADLVRKGTIGEIGQVRVEFFKGVDFGGGFRHSMDYPLLIDMSIHHFDLIRFMTGLDAVAVKGEAWNPPWSNYRGDCSNSVVFEMSNGARVIYTASWCSKGEHCSWNGNWHIEGSKGCIVCEQDEVTLHDVPALYRIKKTRRPRLKGPRKEGQAYVLDEFMKCVKNGTRPATDVTDNIRSIAMVFAAVKAVKTGKRVEVLDKGLRELLG